MTAPGPGVVFAAAMSHAPHISAFPELAEPSQREAIYSAMSELGRQLRAADPDVLVLVSSDHFTNLSPAESTQFLVGSGSVFHGPVEDWIGIEKRQVNGSMRMRPRSSARSRTSRPESVLRPSGWNTVS